MHMIFDQHASLDGVWWVRDHGMGNASEMLGRLPHTAREQRVSVHQEGLREAPGPLRVEVCVRKVWLDWARHNLTLRASEGPCT